jgi:hypothetical protein
VFVVFFLGNDFGIKGRDVSPLNAAPHGPYCWPLPAPIDKGNLAKKKRKRGEERGEEQKKTRRTKKKKKERSKVRRSRKTSIGVSSSIFVPERRQKK